MCGIIAVKLQQGIVETDKLQLALDTLHTRGPDGEGLWQSDSRQVALGHKRLSIIGLGNSQQPISNEDKTIHIVVNGEFYGFEEIRTKLEEQGHQFQTDSDSEIALHLYEQYGLDCLDYLRGEFAFVLYDEKKEQLFAARDRFGIKPLCYAIVENNLFIASQAKALFALGVEKYWDHQSLFHSCHMQYVLPDRTLFRGITQLQPGYFLIAKDKKLTSHCYWDSNYSSSVKNYDANELIAQFRDIFSEAVKLRLRADVPICCHLSGGLDSSAVLGLAVKYSNKPIPAFCVSFSEQNYNELAIAKETAQLVGVPLHVVPISQEKLIAHLSDAVYASEGIAINGHLPAKYLLNQAIRQAGYKVALTGEGSDEVVAGYPHFRMDLLRQQQNHQEMESLQQKNLASVGIMLAEGNSLSTDAILQRLAFVPSFLQAKASLGYKLRGFLSEDFKQSFVAKDSYRDLMNHITADLTSFEQVNQSMYLWQKTSLPNYILKTLGDGCEMAHSIEGRLPFLDHKLFEFVQTLPTNLKINKLVEKYILREATRDVLSERVYKRQKHPFVAPPISVFSSHSSHEMMNDLLTSQSFCHLSIFNHAKVAELLAMCQKKDSRQQVFDPVLLTILSIAILNQCYQLKE